MCFDAFSGQEKIFAGCCDLVNLSGNKPKSQGICRNKPEDLATRRSDFRSVKSTLIHFWGFTVCFFSWFWPKMKKSTNFKSDYRSQKLFKNVRKKFWETLRHRAIQRTSNQVHTTRGCWYIFEYMNFYLKWLQALGT